MNKSPVTTVLLGLLMLNTAVTAAFACSYVLSLRELQRIRGEMDFVNHNRSLFQGLINDAVEYGQRNRAIDPVLESAGIKPQRGGPANAAKPGNR